jgi:hypothetical protein
MREVTIAALIALCCAIGNGQTPKPRTYLAGSPESVAVTMWSKILTTCPVPKATSTATFFAVPGKDVYEYRGTWTKYFPKKITEADRLNGVQLQGMAVFGASLLRVMESRRGGREWSSWSDGHKASDVYAGIDGLPSNSLIGWETCGSF